MYPSFAGMLGQLAGTIIGFVLLPFALTLLVDGLYIGVKRARWSPFVLALFLAAATGAVAIGLQAWGIEQQRTSDLGIPIADFSASIELLLPFAVALALGALVIRLVRYRTPK